MQQKTHATKSARSFLNNIVIGLDLGDRWSRYCMLDNAGGVLTMKTGCAAHLPAPQTNSFLQSIRNLQRGLVCALRACAAT